MLLSTATRNSAGAVVGTVGFTILLFIVGQIPGLEGVKPYLLTEQYENWHGLLRTPTDWAPDRALRLGVRAVCGARAVRRLPRLPAPRRRGG